MRYITIVSGNSDLVQSGGKLRLVRLLHECLSESTTSTKTEPASNQPPSLETTYLCQPHCVRSDGPLAGPRAGAVRDHSSSLAGACLPGLSLV